MNPKFTIAAVAVLLLAASGCAPGRPDEPAAGGGPEAPEPAASGRVVIIGLDGADWEILDRLEADGHIPNLARLRREGASGVLRSQEPMLSPILWTTIATGRSPLDHGIVGFLTARNGRTEPVRSDERRVPAFWEVASAHGRTVGVVGWYASWPADPVDGFLVSDRVGVHQVAGDSTALPDRAVHPPGLAPEVAAMRSRVFEALGTAQATRFFRGGEGGTTLEIDRQALDAFVGVLRTTELYRHLFPALLRSHAPDLAAVYLEGTDAVGHLFAAYQDPPLPTVDPGLAPHLAPAFDRYYAYVDQIVGEWLHEVDPATTTVIVVSDHGFRTGDRRPRLPPRTSGGDPAPLWHRPEGIVMLWGRGVREGARVDGARIHDVVPTVFRLAGIPLTEEFAGRPMDGALSDDILSRPLRTVPRYDVGDRPDAAPAGGEGTEEIVAKLRALGYVGGSGGRAIRARPDADGQLALPINRYNLGIILLEDGESDAALDLFRDLQRDEPDLPLGWLGEATALSRAGDSAASERAMAGARARGFDLE